MILTRQKAILVISKDTAVGEAVALAMYEQHARMHEFKAGLITCTYDELARGFARIGPGARVGIASNCGLLDRGKLINIKPMITAETIRTEKRGEDAVWYDNPLWIFVAEGIVPALADFRRFTVITVEN